MRTFKLFVIIYTITIACQTNQNNLKANMNIIENVSAEEFSILIESHSKALVDVRTLDEFKTGFIPGATLIDVHDPKFLEKVKNLNVGDTLLLYCRSGGRSSSAANALKNMGFKKIYNLSGGIGSWKNDQKEITTPEIGQTEEEYDLEKFQALLNNESIQLIDFNSSWCSPCIAMKPKVELLKQKYPNQVHILDIDKNKTLVEHYRIMGIPTFIVFKNGKEVKRANGILSEEQLLNLMNI